MAESETLDLLSWSPKVAARNADPVTSHMAADRAAKWASEARLSVLFLLAERPMTDFELAFETGRAQTSIGKRRGECRDEGLVEIALDGRGEEVRRPAPSGSPALVWQLTAKGRDFIENRIRRAA